MIEPSPPRISEFLFRHATRSPGKEFLISEGARLTYAEVAAAVTRMSRAMLAAGVRPGDRVATFSNPSPEFVVTFLAATDIGAVWVGLNPKYTRPELQHVVENSSPALLFGFLDHQGPTSAADLLAGFSNDSRTRVVTLDRTIAGAEGVDAFLSLGDRLTESQLAAARAAVSPDQAALLVYTSGTTGSPKGAVLSHESLIWSFSRQGERWGGDSLRMILNLPINHSGSVGDIFLSALAVGGTLLLMERFDPDQMLELVSREQINTLMQIPTMFQILVSRPGFETADLSSLRSVVWGGAAMPAPVLTKLQAPGRQLGVVYGLTEAPASITYTDSDATVEQLTITAGRPDPDMEVRLADETGRVRPIGTPGEIQVRHRSTFQGYFRNPEATEAAFTEDGFLKTGDRAVMRPDGHLQIVGRIKEMYKSGGYNVYPREIELCLESHPGVSMALVVSRPDEVFDEVGHAFIVPQKPYELSSTELLDWCRERLANYKIPKGITVTDALPMLPIGKPDRRALRASAVRLHIESTTPVRIDQV